MSEPRRIVTADLADDLARRLADAVGRGAHIALTGGSTPGPGYERLAALPVEWERCTLWFGDDRCVPPDDERSNFRLVNEALLRRLAAPGPRVERIEGECGPEEGATRYERALAGVFGPGIPELDLVLLGIGPDGHCASLFPGDAALEERKRAVVGVERAGLPPYVPRVTITLPVINAAREVLFVAAGADKAAAVARALAGDPAVPAGRVAPRSGALTFLLDAEAAGEV